MSDLRSGFLVFLIALPLCLGIAMASGFPPMAGLLTAIVGGIIPTILGGSPLTIKGPAAGLIVIILGAVQELGYEKCLAVGVIAALIQIIFSRLGAGKIARYVPVPVVEGMLAAIGVIIIAKQLHIMLGVLPSSKTPIQLLAEVPHSIANSNPEILAIGMVTLMTVWFYPLLPGSILKKIPPALISLLFVLPLAMYWHLDLDHFYWFEGQRFEVGPQFLVTLPANFLSSITLPDFSALSNPIAWKYIIMLALIGSLESLLTVMAVDKKASLDRDLFAVGVANFFSSMIGGLPMISEVVRSKANIDAGAQSRFSNFYHGIFILVAVTVLTPVIHLIPLSALAALLIITGLRLASPKAFAHMYDLGIPTLVVFLATLLITLKVDLLIGVLSGLVIKSVLDYTPYAVKPLPAEVSYEDEA